MAEGISDIIIKDQLLQWSLRDQTSDVIDNHFNLMNSSDVYKKMIKSDKSYYPKQIEILKSDCQLFDDFCTEYLKLSYYNKDDGLPNYPSFRELAIAYIRFIYSRIGAEAGNADKRTLRNESSADKC